MFSLFNHRFDSTPIVSVPTLGKVFIAWCTKNKEGDWEVGEDFIHDKWAEDCNSIQGAESIRSEKVDLDYEKHYYDNHYIMIVCTFYKGKAEKKIFYSPEHLFLVLSRLRNTSQEGKTYPNDWEDSWPTQPQYASDELENIDEWTTHDRIAHHLAMKG